MRCPVCGEKTRKVRLDRYYCAHCRKTWLIHELHVELGDEEEK